MHQMYGEIHQDQINAKHGTRFKMPTLCYSPLMSVAYGKTYKEAGLDGQITASKQLEKLACK